MPNFEKDVSPSWSGLSQDTSPSLKKNESHLAQLSFLGYEVSSDVVKPDSKHTDGLLQLQSPENVKEVQAFVGLLQYVFCPNSQQLKVISTQWWQRSGGNCYSYIRETRHRYHLFPKRDGNRSFNRRIFEKNIGLENGTTIKNWIEKLQKRQMLDNSKQFDL